MNNIEVKELITDFTINSKCSNCGQCCSDLLPMSEFEVSRIKHFITKNNIKEQRHNSMMGVDITCPFRDEATRNVLFILFALQYANSLFVIILKKIL